MGQSDIPLSDVGHEEALRAVILLRKHSVDTVVSSPLLRCLASIKPFCEAVKCELLFNPSLAERAWGVYEGLPKAERGRDTQPVGGEEDQVFHDRVRRAVRTLPEQGNTLVVAHSGVFRELLNCGYGPLSPCSKVPHAVPVPLVRST